jgi:hypothetical protein
MAKDEKEILEMITKYNAHKGGAKGEWYVGAGKDPKKDLFKTHGVIKEKDFWVYDFAVDAQELGRAMDKLLMMGYDGEAPKAYDGLGFYVYQKRQHTKE